MKKNVNNILHLTVALISVVLMVGLTASCSKDDDLDDEVKSLEALSETVSQKPDKDLKLGQSTETIVNEDSCIVEGDGYTVELSPTVVEDDTKLLVTPAAVAPGLFSNNDEVKAFDLKVGNLTEFKGVAKLHIPITLNSDEVLVGVSWDERERNWTPARCEYDKTTREAIVYTDKPGTFGVGKTKAPNMQTRADNVTFGQFIVDRANTRAAGINENRFAYINWEDEPLLVFNALTTKLFTDDSNGMLTEADAITSGILDKKTLFADISYSLIKELGFSFAFLEKTSKFMGYLAIGATFYQKMRAIAQGDVNKADGMTLKGVLDLVTKAATKFLKSSALNLGMIAVAIIDYSLNKFAEEAWSGRKDLYKRAFDLYYSKGNDGYRSFQQWYDLFWPAFTKEGMTEMRLNALIDAYVTQYCEKFWEDEVVVATYLGFIDMNWTGGGGVNESIRHELSAELRGKLYSDKKLLPAVFDAIGEKLQEKQYDIMKDQMMKYAKHMNQIVTLKFKDSSVKGGKSAYAGYTVKFKRLPISITDPDYWECKLDDKGEGEIKFRLYAYAAAGVRPQMVILRNKLDLNSVEKELTLKNLEPGVNTIELGGEETPDLPLMTISVEGWVAVKYERYESQNGGEERLTGVYSKGEHHNLEFILNNHNSNSNYPGEIQIDNNWHVVAKRSPSETDSTYHEFLSFDLPGGLEATSIKNISYTKEYTSSGGYWSDQTWKEHWTIEEVPLERPITGSNPNYYGLLFNTKEGDELPIDNWTFWYRTFYHKTDVSSEGTRYCVYELRESDSDFPNRMEVRLEFGSW